MKRSFKNVTDVTNLLVKCNGQQQSCNVIVTADNDAYNCSVLSVLQSVLSVLPSVLLYCSPKVVFCIAVLPAL